MGQGSNNNNNQQTNTQPGVKIDLSNLRPTTRFSDLHDDLKKTIESIDSFIRQQESYASQCEGLVAGHKADVESIKPDVDLIQSNLETMELALENDGAAINNAKDLVQRDAADLIRVARMAENLGLPQQYHHHYYSHNTTNANNTTTHRPSSSSAASTATDDDHYDMNLVAYFATQAQVMQTTLDTYTSHMAEIEAHLRVVESSTVHQAHQLAAQRAGGGNGGGNNNHTQDQVRELAETLRGFEGGILAAAGKVGSCREGVNELILGNVRGAGSAADTRDSPFNYASRSVRF
jgi:nucleoporin p58/p45